ncbi:flavodoxin [Nocardia cyriacigeorgica]|uniref:Flavodoxin n=1 Tax=Nocardia cyriacigeorgica TaxID=135487 RepID=A0ABX0CIE5_9NOCA|nr:flavodoxin domain-containing protein [Nocardia cyriacigeorgica]NEW48926.1 flavodoxin [Nocardia cyriacigeorgica]NEW55027.1 flavodoxin [Nocardia cyriacigeorgica]
MDNNRLRIAILYATEQGSTRDIAEFIADDLAGRGAEVMLHDIEHAPDLSPFGTIIIGSAIHNMDLLPAASAYIHAHRDQLTGSRVWMFSVGLGPALRGPLGRRLGRVVPKKVAELRDTIRPRGYHAFAGRYDRAGAGWKARTLYRLMGGARYGDLRDWAAIRTWSNDIASALGLPHSAANTVHP